MKKALTPITAALALVLAAGTGASAQTVARDVMRDVVREAGRLHAVVRDGQSRDFKVEQIDRQTKTLAIGPTGQVSLKNVVGDITVKAGGARGDATLEIVRTSRGRTDADAKLGLERVTVVVTTSSERADVEAKYPNERRPDYSVSVAYTLTAPAGTGVDIRTVTGRVRVSGLQGGVAAQAISGNIDLASCAGVEKISTVSGSITATDIRSDTTFEAQVITGEVNIANVKARRVVAGIISGTVSARDIQADGATLSAMSGNVEYSGSVAPKGRYEFKAHSGSVRLGLLGSFDLEASTFAGRVEADPSLGLPASDNRRSLRGTVGNGGAAVVATTFSGNVWVGRKTS